MSNYIRRFLREIKQKIGLIMLEFELRVKIAGKALKRFFSFSKKKGEAPPEIHDYTEQATAYLEECYQPPAPPKKEESRPRQRFSIDLPPLQSVEKEGKGRYSIGSAPFLDDHYDGDRVTRLMRNASDYSASALNRELDHNLNKTFTDKLIELIRDKNLRDSEVYRAAQMDRRLFSKIMSDRNFRPAKNTALALVFALRLKPEQATDLLERAGYTLSHSSKRDVIIEFFIQEGISNLTEINLVLDNLGEKIIGR